MEPTITLECTLDDWEQLKELEHQLKQIHGLTVFLVEPKDDDAPVLISVSIGKENEQTEARIRRVAHTLYDFVHGSEVVQLQASLVTIEGERVDILSLTAEEIVQQINEAYFG